MKKSSYTFTSNNTTETLTLNNSEFNRHLRKFFENDINAIVQVADNDACHVEIYTAKKMVGDRIMVCKKSKQPHGETQFKLFVNDATEPIEAANPCQMYVTTKSTLKADPNARVRVQTKNEAGEWVDYKIWVANGDGMKNLLKKEKDISEWENVYTVTHFSPDLKVRSTDKFENYNKTWLKMKEIFANHDDAIVKIELNGSTIKTLKLVIDKSGKRSMKQMKKAELDALKPAEPEVKTVKKSVKRATKKVAAEA